VRCESPSWCDSLSVACKVRDVHLTNGAWCLAEDLFQADANVAVPHPEVLWAIGED
jgi:hypothetical protein